MQSERGHSLGPSISTITGASHRDVATSTGPPQSRTKVDTGEWMQELPKLLGGFGPTFKRSRKLILTRIDIYLFRKCKISWSSSMASTARCPLPSPQGWPQKTGDGPGASQHHQFPLHRVDVHQIQVQDLKLNEQEESESKLNQLLPLNHSNKTTNKKYDLLWW